MALALLWAGLFGPDPARAEDLAEIFQDDQPIKVIYPKQNQQMGAVDSSFIFGNIPPALVDRYVLTVNSRPVEVHAEGGFLAFVPLRPGSFEFIIELRPEGKQNERKSFVKVLRVYVPEPISVTRSDTLLIASEYRPPAGDLVLTEGERLEFSFRGTPGLLAYASIEGLADSIPMAETDPQPQPYWGESVFGAGAIPEKLLIDGIYSGSFTIPAATIVDSTPIIYHLVRPDNAALMAEAYFHPSPENSRRLTDLYAQPNQVSLPSRRHLSTNQPDYPFTIRLTDTVQIIRHAPRMGYFSIFQPTGVEALAIGRMGDWYKLRLSQTQFAWAEMAKVERLPQGIRPEKSLPAAIRTFAYRDSTQLVIPLSGQHPFQIIETQPNQLQLNLFGVTTNTDWIRYDGTDSQIDFITWGQPEPDWYQLNIDLTDPLWGYETHYEGNTFYLTLMKRPCQLERLKGKTIVIDPGHSSDLGAVGPTGYTEAEANLGIALLLEHMLKRAGADVIMTRADMSHVPLYGRPAIARAVDADLFISIHNNALPDGVNPFENNGVSTYYYHLHSIELARAILNELVEATGLDNHGLYHGNLAVNRPTQYPAVLIECAFMMIPEQEAALKTYRYRKKVAGAIMRGIETFLTDSEEKSQTGAIDCE